MIEEYLDEYPVSYKCPRITIKKGRCEGKPCIRGTEITVKSISSLANVGINQNEILEGFPQLTMEDLYDVYVYYHGPWIMFRNLDVIDSNQETIRVES
jgi:uncharacterized protein (DUF433 family)